MPVLGTSDVPGQLIGPRPARGSLTTIPLSVTLPVLVTTNEYVTFWLAALTVEGDADLVTWIDGARVVVTVSASVSTIGPVTPAGGVDVTVARLTIDPASISDCVAV